MTIAMTVNRWARGTALAGMTAVTLLLAQPPASAEPLQMWERSGGNESFVGDTRFLESRPPHLSHWQMFQDEMRDLRTKSPHSLDYAIFLEIRRRGSCPFTTR